jgi:hypothetical protein
MPSKSKAQRNFMAAVAHNPAFAKKAGVPQSVGKDFNEADKGRKFARGGDTMAKKSSELDDDVATVKRALYKQPGDAALYSRERGLSPGMARRRLDDRGVDVRALVANEQNPDDLGNFKKGGNVKKMNMGGYAGGGMPMVMKDGQKVPAFAADGKGKMAKGGMAKADMKQDKAMMQKAVNKHEGRLHKGSTMTKLAKGGFTKSANGIAQRGLTKGKQIAMKNGGKC